jgi:putative ABC transport system permease protein
MTMLTPARVLRRLGALLAARRLDQELDEELRFHLEMETKRRVSSGMSERDARDAALRAFGGMASHRDAARDARGVRPVEDFLQDLRVATRMLAKRPAVALVAILTFAIGIGGTTALWSAVYRLLLQPYPFRDADRIVSVQQFNTRSSQYGEVAPANFLDVKARSRSFDMLAAAEPWSVDWVGPEGPEKIEAALVTEDAFPIQGLTPLVGRAFARDEFVAGRDNVVILSEALWRTRFGADPSVVGRAVTLDTTPRVVVGVMPEEALQPYGAKLWLPKISRPDDQRARGNGYWTVLGRLAPGVTLEQANAELRRVASELGAEHAENRDIVVRALSLREAMAGSARGGLLVLFAAVCFVLLIACVNLASLQLAESVRRRRELAIRTAIGAGGGRLVRQLLAENLLLAFLGAAAGLVIARWGVAAIRAFAPDSLWQLRTLQLATPAFLFAFTVATLAAAAVALVPVLGLRRLELAAHLVGGERTGTSRARTRVNRVLVVSEIALALVLLVGAGLLVRSLGTLLQVDRGFRADHVLVATLHAWSYYRTPPQRAEFVRQAIGRLSALPGVERVGMTSSLPLSYPIGFERPRVRVEGSGVALEDQLPAVHTSAITTGYLEALEIPLVQGRAFTATDAANAPPVTLVNRAFVRRFLANENPLGKRLTFGFGRGAPVSREIVGVVGDVRHEELHSAPEPAVFVPHAQAPTGAIHLVMRTSIEPMLLERRVRGELAAINGAMPLGRVTSMEAQMAESLQQQRFQLSLLAAFSISALLLAAIGIYGVMSRTTGERTHEIGLRMAVGARARDVRWMVLRTAGTLAVIGIAIGTFAAIALTRYISGMLFGVTPLDPLTYVAAAAILLVVAGVASWMPAWRASTVEPVRALRAD